MNTRAFLVSMLLAAVGGLVGCDRDEGVAFNTVPKDPPRTVAAAATQPVAAAPSIQWTVPSGWKEMPPQAMRYASFAVRPDDPALVLTVIPLPPQPLGPNVNRWEQQLGLPPTPEADLNKVVRRIVVAEVPVDLVDLTSAPAAAGGGAQQRMLAAIVNQADRVWFFKLMGPADKVAAHKDEFESFVRSVRFGESAK